MSKDKIPTAEEFLKEKDFINFTIGKAKGNERCSDMMIAYAKLCVEAALKAVIKNTGFIQMQAEHLNSEEYRPFITAEDGTIWVIDEQAIRNAYPLDNIK
jgi:hypothetical protein